MAENGTAVVDRLDPEPRAADIAGPLVGECLDPHHPSIVRRALIAWTDGQGGEERRHWLPTLQGLSLRRGDRVLLMRPKNYEEAVIVGVLDGFVRREPVDAARGPVVELKPDEVVTVTDEAGRPVAELRQGDGGPSIALIGDDCRLEVAGRLILSGRDVVITAREGNAAVEAAGDVDIKAETINLN